MGVDVSQDHLIAGIASDCGGKYWQPIKLENYSNGNYHCSGDTQVDIENYIKNLKWMTPRPNTYGIEKCLVISNISGKFYANDNDCDSKRCSICTVPVAHSFYLRGPGPKGIDRWHRLGLRNFLDREYSLPLELQHNSSRLVFEGQNGLSQIIWYPTKKNALIKRYDDKYILDRQKTLTFKYNTDPFGHFRSLEWVLTGVSCLSYTKTSLVAFYSISVCFSSSAIQSYSLANNSDSAWLQNKTKIT